LYAKDGQQKGHGEEGSSEEELCQQGTCEACYQNHECEEVDCSEDAGQKSGEEDCRTSNRREKQAGKGTGQETKETGLQKIASYVWNV
jgi:hypothetical protein